MWLQTLLFGLNVVVSAALAPKPPEPPSAATLADIDVPTAEDGRSQPIIFGTTLFKSPNNAWYGDLSSVAIRK